MTPDLKTIVFPVTDVVQAKALYGTLFGVEPTNDTPYYVVYRVGDLDVRLDPNGHRQGLTGPVAYWHVPDINARLAQLLAAGAEPLQPVHEVGGGRQIAAVKDADGNIVGLLQDPA